MGIIGWVIAGTVGVAALVLIFAGPSLFKKLFNWSQDGKKPDLSPEIDKTLSGVKSAGKGLIDLVTDLFDGDDDMDIVTNGEMGFHLVSRYLASNGMDTSDQASITLEQYRQILQDAKMQYTAPTGPLIPTDKKGGEDVS